MTKVKSINLNTNIVHHPKRNIDLVLVTPANIIDIQKKVEKIKFIFLDVILYYDLSKLELYRLSLQRNFSQISTSICVFYHRKNLADVLDQVVSM